MTTRNAKIMKWTGWTLSAIPVLMLGVLPLIFVTTQQKAVVEAMSKYGYPTQYSFGIFFVEMACALIYAVPMTSVLGAILLTGYLGGAVATHVRADELGSVVGPVLFGVLLWLGLFLRDARLRALVPFRSRQQ